LRGYKYFISIIAAFGIISVTAFLAGCSGGSDQKHDMQQQSAQGEKSEEKEPEKLKKVEEQVENLFDALGGPNVKTESEDKQGGQQQSSQQKDGQQDEQQKSGQQKDEQQQGDQQKDGQQQNGQQQDEGQQQDDQQKEGQQKQDQQQGEQQNDDQKKDGQQQTVDKWSQLGNIISNLHYQWNDLMPEIAKKGADMKLIDNFDNALNSLTTAAETKEQDKVLASANKLYSYVPDLYSLYRVKMSPEVKRMIYYTRNIILESDKSNWDQVANDNEALEKSWSLFRNTLEENQKTIGDKLDFSIYELKKVISEKNKQLTDIKGRLVLNNIKELQKSFEENK